MSVQVENHSLGQLIVVRFYCHPKDMAITHKRLDDLFVKLCATGFSFVIPGDFNISSEDMAIWLAEHHPRTHIGEGGTLVSLPLGPPRSITFCFMGLSVT